MFLCLRELIARTDSVTTLKKRLTQSRVRNVTIWKNALTKWYVFLKVEGSLRGHITSNQTLKSFFEIPFSFFGIQYRVISSFSKNGKYLMFGQMHCEGYFALYTQNVLRSRVVLSKIV